MKLNNSTNFKNIPRKAQKNDFSFTSQNDIKSQIEKRNPTNISKTQNARVVSSRCCSEIKDIHNYVSKSRSRSNLD